MIIRAWTAHATPENAERCRTRFVEEVLPELKPLAGYLGASFGRRSDGDEIELVLLTWWESLESVRPFAGPDIDRAVVREKAAEIMTRWDEFVRHYEVAFEDGASAPGKRPRAPSTSRPRPSKRTSRSKKKKR